MNLLGFSGLKGIFFDGPVRNSVRCMENGGLRVAIGYNKINITVFQVFDLEKNSIWPEKT